MPSQSKFAVGVEPTLTRQHEWRVSVTTNGYQWFSLPVTFVDKDRAERVAAVLRVELAPEAERLDEETRALVEGGG